MIICEYQDLIKYQALLPYLKNGLDCIEKLRRDGFPVGRYEFEGGYLLVQAGETKMYAAAAFEAHRNYIDVQYAIEGGEAAYWAPISRLKPAVEYLERKDVEFFEGKDAATKLIVKPGMCYVAFPEDGHMPNRNVIVKNAYRKIVMKLPVAE